ncbi:MAG: RNB domain-containing ribonuclease [Alistipes sp.]|jgi:exoribonuclease R|nr:RNB domain-containing ribonuclease [Alistipes sp.]
MGKRKQAAEPFGRGKKSEKIARETRSRKIEIESQTYTGSVDMTASGSMYITVDELDSDVFVDFRNGGHALDGDRVEVVVTHRKRNGNLEGEVVKVLERNPRNYVGVLDLADHSVFLKPDTRKMPVDIYIKRQEDGLSNGHELKNGQKAVVKIVDWPDGAKCPIGLVVDVLGEAGDNNTEMHAIMAEFDLPYQFEPQVSMAADAISENISEAEIARRRDFRSVTTFTIDPEDAKDFDDALSIRRLSECKNVRDIPLNISDKENLGSKNISQNSNEKTLFSAQKTNQKSRDEGYGTKTKTGAVENPDLWEIGVHIADVTHYVTPNSIVNTEAENRATSVYLVDRTVPMLPEKLSNDLCSLRLNEDKLCFSAVFEIDDNLKIHSEWFGRTIIRSDRRFSYEEAQAVIEGHKNGKYAADNGSADGCDCESAADNGSEDGCDCESAADNGHTSGYNRENGRNDIVEGATATVITIATGALTNGKKRGKTGDVNRGEIGGGNNDGANGETDDVAKHATASGVEDALFSGAESAPASETKGVAAAKSFETKAAIAAKSFETKAAIATKKIASNSTAAAKKSETDGAPSAKDFEAEILKLNELAQAMRRVRFANGAITFDREEFKFRLAPDGKPLGVYHKVQKESNQLIEEFMLLANRRVAEFIGRGGAISQRATANSGGVNYPASSAIPSAVSAFADSNSTSADAIPRGANSPAATTRREGIEGREGSEATATLASNDDNKSASCGAISQRANTIASDAIPQRANTPAATASGNAPESLAPTTTRDNNESPRHPHTGRPNETIKTTKNNKTNRTFVYRVHDKPDEDKLLKFSDFVIRFGYYFRPDRIKDVSRQMNELMSRIKGRSEENVISTLAIRTMAKAYYSTDNIGHYGLAFPYYTHFTSPIRRYPDMMVHRLLAHYLDGGKSADKPNFERLCEHSSGMEVRAADAERASVKYKMAEYMLDKLGQEFDGHISGITDWGIYVELNESLIEGMVSMRDVADDFYRFDENIYAAVGQANGRKFTLGDQVRIRVKGADLARRIIDFSLVATIDFETGRVDPLPEVGLRDGGFGRRGDERVFRSKNDRGGKKSRKEKDRRKSLKY